MKSRVLLTYGLAFVAMMVLAAPAQGALATQYLGYDTISKIQDIDWEIVVLGDGNTTIDIGDTLLGVFEAEKIYPDYSDTTTFFDPLEGTDVNFTAIFATTVTNKTPDGSSWIWDFGPVSAGDWTTLQTSYPNLPNRLGGAGTEVIVYSDSISTAGGWVEPDGDVDATIGRASDGQLLWELGVAAGDPTEFWQADAKNDDLATLSALDNLSWNAGLSVTYTDPIVAGLDVLTHDALNFGTDYQVELHGSSEGVMDGQWLVTDTDIYVRVIPEPTSVLIWSTILAFLGLAAIRRRLRK